MLTATGCNVLIAGADCHWLERFDRASRRPLRPDQQYRSTPVLTIITTYSPQVLLHGGPDVQRRYLARLVLAVVPWTNCHTHSVRTFAQLVLVALLQRFPLGAPVWEQSTAAANAAAAKAAAAGATAAGGAGGAGGTAAGAAAAAAAAQPPRDSWLDASLASGASISAIAVNEGSADGDYDAGDAAADDNVIGFVGPSVQPGCGDYQYLRHVMRYYDTNADIVRLRKGMGAAILTWTPEGVTSPRRIFSSGALRLCFITTLYQTIQRPIESPAPPGVCCLSDRLETAIAPCRTTTIVSVLTPFPPQLSLHAGVHLAGTPDDAVGFEGAPLALMDAVSAFLTAERCKLREQLHDRDAEAELNELQARLLGCCRAYWLLSCVLVDVVRTGCVLVLGLLSCWLEAGCLNFMTCANNELQARRQSVDMCFCFYSVSDGAWLLDGRRLL